MRLAAKLALSSALLAGVAIVGPGFCSNSTTPAQSQDVTAQSHVIRRSVIKVHTENGVVILPGTADTWDSVEEALFVADSIAEVQMVNIEVPWQVAYD